MRLMEAQFRILAEKKEYALKAIKELKGKGTIQGRAGRHFSWVEDSKFVDVQYLEEALKAWRWYPKNDTDGNIIGISFEGEKAGDDKILFDAIAPFVEDESYIQMRGEEEDIWRWEFDNGKCKEKKARIEFD